MMSVESGELRVELFAGETQRSEHSVMLNEIYYSCSQKRIV